MLTTLVHVSVQQLLLCCLGFRGPNHPEGRQGRGGGGGGAALSIVIRGHRLSFQLLTCGWSRVQVEDWRESATSMPYMRQPSPGFYTFLAPEVQRITLPDSISANPVGCCIVHNTIALQLM